MKYLILFSFLCCVNSTTTHPIYLSTTEIRYFDSHQVLGIEMKLFAEDLETVFSRRYGELVEIGTDREHPKATEYIKTYLEKNFELMINSKQKEWEYVGREEDKEDINAIWVYLKVEKVRKPKEIKVRNSVLLDFTDSQQNIVIVKVGETIKRGKLIKGNDSKVFEF